MDLLSKIRYEASGKKTDRVDPISLVDVKKLSKKKTPKVKVKKLVNAKDLEAVEIPTVDAEIKKGSSNPKDQADLFRTDQAR